jgi:hypothetical protein
MGAILDDLWDHEGYGARRLPDGTLTATWSAETNVFDAYVAACSCGWHRSEHPQGEDGYESAVDEWEVDHARPLLAETVPAAVATAIPDAKQTIGSLVGERPEAARRALDDLAGWATAMRQGLGPHETPGQKVDRMRARLAGSTNAKEREALAGGREHRPAAGRQL